MWRKNFIVCLILLFPFISIAQSSEDMERILHLTGFQSPEELDGHEVERLCSYLQHPLKLNLASTSKLRSSGLFTAFQAACITDYRVRHGDVMSYAELAAIDGFTDEVVRTLMPFISLDGGDSTVGAGVQDQVINDFAVRGGMKVSDQRFTGGYAAKYRCGLGDGWTMSLAASRAYSEDWGLPDALSGCICWEPSRRQFRLIAGDFNSRFGQGLVLWNGMSMTGLSKTSSFFRSASTISPIWSFTGSSAYTGIAGEFTAARLRVSAFLALPGLKTQGFNGTSIMPALNFGWYGKNICVSLSHYLEYVPVSVGHPGHIPDMKTSADIAMTVDGTDVFSEVAFDWVNLTPAVLAGTRFPIGEDIVMAAHLRFYPPSFNPSRSAAPRSVSKCSNEYGLSFACDYSPDNEVISGSLSFDTAFLPESKADDGSSIHLKLSGDSEIMLSEALSLKIRFSERYRTWGQKFKTDVRTDLIWTIARFTISGRINLLQYVGTSFLAYIEGGYKNERLSIYLRQLFFIADNWDDRIYAYERDAPGSFSVPAFYGRGMNTALSVSWKFSRWGKLYAKGGMTSYPFMSDEKKKPGKAELKLQFVFSF